MNVHEVLSWSAWGVVSAYGSLFLLRELLPFIAAAWYQAVGASAWSAAPGGGPPPTGGEPTPGRVEVVAALKLLGWLSLWMAACLVWASLLLATRGVIAGGYPLARALYG